MGYDFDLYDLKMSDFNSQGRHRHLINDKAGLLRFERRVQFGVRFEPSGCVHRLGQRKGEYSRSDFWLTSVQGLSMGFRSRRISIHFSRHNTFTHL